MARKSLLASTLFAVFSAVTAAAGDFIRVEEDETSARLQTAVTRYEKGGVSVELIGAIHIADKAYYDTLNALFKNHDVLLFEMVGGERIAEPVPVEAEAGENKLAGLRTLYDAISRRLKLTGQGDVIDYRAANFVHADLSAAEFGEKQAGRKESLFSFALASSLAADKEARQPNPVRLLKAVISGSPDLLKLELIHTMGQGDDQIASLAGESVVITDRNIRCLEVMNREIAAGHHKLGIFYGAAHFPDMEKRLLEQGYQQTAREWLTAWDVPKR